MTLHLGGERAAALVDGQLDHRARDFALAHIAHCTTCWAEVDTQRRLKSQLVGLGAPGLPPVLAERLVGLGSQIAPGPSPRSGRVPASRFPTIPILPAAAFTAGPVSPPRQAPVHEQAHPDIPTHPDIPAHPVRRSHTRHVLAGSAFVLAMGAGGALALGGTATATHEPAVTPPVGAFLAQHVETTSLWPIGDPSLTVAATSQQR